MKKNSISAIIAVVFCALGIAFMIVQKFIVSEWDLSIISNVFLGIGLIAFLFVMNSNKPK